MELMVSFLISHDHTSRIKGVVHIECSERAIYGRVGLTPKGVLNLRMALMNSFLARD